MIEVTLELTRNKKVGHGWFDKVNIDTCELDFLSPIQGSIYTKEATFLIDENEFYISKEDYSSWKNDRATYTIYYAKDDDLISIASIDYVNSSKTMSAIDDETKQVLIESYAKSSNGHKTYRALCSAARYWYNKNVDKSKEDIPKELIETLSELINKYGSDTVEKAMRRWLYDRK